MNRTKMKEINDNIWIADSGASCHMTNSLEGMKDIKTDYSKIKIENRKTVMSIKKGTFEGMAVSKDSKKTMIQLKNVRYVPDMFCKLISLTQAMRSGYNVLGKKDKITLSQGNFQVSFNRVIRSRKGIILGMMTEN